MPGIGRAGERWIEYRRHGAVVDPLGVLWTLVLHPLTFLMLASLWAFPLAAWFWRARIRPVAGANWAFLDQPSRQLALPRQAALRPGQSFIVGLAGGVVYCGLLLIIRIVVRLTVPEALGSSDVFRLNYFLGQVALAALMQVAVAVVASARVERLGWLHGLFGAFVAGCVMTVGILGLNLLFGGTIDPTFAWNVFGQVVNEGALLALPFALATPAVAGRIRHAHARSIQTVQA